MSITLTAACIEIVASDLDRSLAFYRLLGLDIPATEGPHVDVELPGGNTLAFDTEDTIAAMHPGWSPPAAAGRVTIGFQLQSPADVDALYETVTSAGHHGVLTPFDAPWGQRYATVADPDGTSVDLYALSPS
ncbi:VOC family protein [Mycolicibacterium tokaiense]|uniref:Glyoxalase/bleomycin resistance protein/dioxygenase n=1 Tax=Mycolicibacterium tokaiense TaxID=39695 RepID=A0A378TEB2_9MYCO|nr:VOC family protein [Mycolicibacterium tokaiense]STZ58960.1 glyoxalase/bleomycin resistance protein/dioxygenase [Mycolicibacterium tokaiense]